MAVQAPTLPYPDMDFTPLDILTAEEMNQLVQNDQCLATYCKGLHDGTNISDGMILALGKKLFPVGTIIGTHENKNPQTYLGGTWEAYAKGQTLVGVNPNDTDFNQAGKTGGAKTITLTTDQMPKHRHSWRGVNPGTSVSGQFGHQPFQIDNDKASNWDGSADCVGETGGNKPHDNMPPYITVYYWRRTA